MSIKFQIRLLKRRIVKTQNTDVQINLRFGFFPERFWVGYEFGKQASKSVVRGSVFALRLNALGFGCRDIARAWR